jgi:hypothetical protein
VPIGKPNIRYRFALFEEDSEATYDAVLVSLPNHIETILYLANFKARKEYRDKRAMRLRMLTRFLWDRINSKDTDVYNKGVLVSEIARLQYEHGNKISEARKVFDENAHSYLESRTLWMAYSE